MKLGQLIREKRNAAGLTLRDVAAKVGISVPYRPRNPPAAVAEKLHPADAWTIDRLRRDLAQDPWLGMTGGAS